MNGQLPFPKYSAHQNGGIWHSHIVQLQHHIQKFKRDLDHASQISGGAKFLRNEWLPRDKNSPDIEPGHALGWAITYVAREQLLKNQSTIDALIEGILDKPVKVWENFGSQVTSNKISELLEVSFS